MKIAQLCSVAHSVSQSTSHGIYNSVGTLCDALVARKHQVSLYAAGDAQTKARLCSVVETNATAREINKADMLREDLETASLCYQNAAAHDMIHSHFSLLGCHFSAIVDTPTVHSIHSPVSPDLLQHLLRYKKERFISFSHAQRKQMPELNWIATVYHGIDTSTYTYANTPEDYVLYLGRITEDKGVKHAVAAAKAAGVPLLIVGSSYSEEGYWSQHIEPHVDGHMVRYLGPAGLQRKIQLMQGARALLFPTLYDEVFGLVAIESMSCGTPVIGFGNGAVPEIVEDGQTGFIVKTEKQMASAIKKLKSISRDACRERAVRFFDTKKMVEGYERVYERTIARAKSKRTP